MNQPTADDEFEPPTYQQLIQLLLKEGIARMRAISQRDALMANMVRIKDLTSDSVQPVIYKLAVEAIQFVKEMR